MKLLHILNAYYSHFLKLLCKLLHKLQYCSTGQKFSTTILVHKKDLIQNKTVNFTESTFFFKTNKEDKKREWGQLICLFQKKKKKGLTLQT